MVLGMRGVRVYYVEVHGRLNFLSVVIAGTPIAAGNQNVFVFKIKVQKFTYTAGL